MDNLSVEGGLQAASGLHERRNGCEGGVTSTTKKETGVLIFLERFLPHTAGRISRQNQKEKSA